MKPKSASASVKANGALYNRICKILESARTEVARTVNTAQVISNWLIGREIVEEEQSGKRRAEYGKALLRELAERLRQQFGNGYSVDNLESFRRFYLNYPALLPFEKSGAVRRKSSLPENSSYNVPTDSWQPGVLHPNLSWTHYRRLLRIEQPEVRAFYEIESLKNNWSARELERQVGSLLYERLALGKGKKAMMKLATKGQVVQTPTDIFKDPVIMEFLGLPESPILLESDIEQALIDNLQTFLLELGKGFAFVARQQRLTLEGDHFYIDLVFYHTILKCYVLIELKTGKLTHQDLGQLQLYVNYYDLECRTEGDGPTLGLILCTDKNDAVVKYTLGPDQARTIFASRYKLHLPSEDQLQTELRREVRLLTGSSRTKRKP